MFRQREREEKREGEKHQCVVASHVPPTKDLACNPGMCPDWELNQRPFDSKASAPSTSLTFVVCCFVYDGRSDHCEVVPHCGFNLHLSDG